MRYPLLISFSIVCCAAVSANQIDSALLKWQSYEQTGYMQTKRAFYQASELALTNRLQSLIGQDKPPERLIESYLERLIPVCIYQGNNKSAEQYATLAIRFANKMSVGPEHEAMLHATLAKVLLKEGKQTQAELEYDKSLDILKAVTSAKTQSKPGGTDFDRAVEESAGRCQLGLAELFTEQRRFEEAEKLYKKAFEHLPPTPPDLVAYAKCLTEQNKLVEAKTALKQALDIDLNELGEGQPALAADYNNLAFVLDREANLSAAEDNMKKAVTICRKYRYTDLADWLANLEIILDSEGKHAEAARLRNERQTLLTSPTTAARLSRPI